MPSYRRTRTAIAAGREGDPPAPKLKHLLRMAMAYWIVAGLVLLGTVLAGSAVTILYFLHSLEG